MLKFNIQMFADGEEDKVETPSFFKTFSSEEDFTKFTQSISSKAKNELLDEIGYKSVSEIKGVVEKGSQYDEVSNKYTEIETKYNSVLAESEKLKVDLLTTKYNINDEFKDEFVTLAKSKVTDEVDIDTAAQSVYEKLNKSFFTEGNKPKIKIGGDGKPPVDDESDIFKNLRKI